MPLEQPLFWLWQSILVLRRIINEALFLPLFTAEELGLRGSRHLAERLSTEKLNLYTMINFEMMGVPFLDRDYQVFANGP